MVAAHVDAAQHQTKSNYMRNPPASEVLNEEIANLLKKKIKSSLTHIDELSMGFDYTGEVTAADAEEIFEKITGLHRRALEGAELAASPERAEQLRLFATNLRRAFYGFEPDFFQHNVTRVVEESIGSDSGIDRAMADTDRNLLVPEDADRIADAAEWPQQRTGDGEPDAGVTR